MYKGNYNTNSIFDFRQKPSFIIDAFLIASYSVSFRTITHTKCDTAFVCCARQSCSLLVFAKSPVVTATLVQHSVASTSIHCTPATKLSSVVGVGELCQTICRLGSGCNQS